MQIMANGLGEFEIEGKPIINAECKMQNAELFGLRRYYKTSLLCNI